MTAKHELVEKLSAQFHAIYQAEAKRQRDVRHHDDYDQLPEHIKEFDRVLARHVIALLATAREEEQKQCATLASILDKCKELEHQRDLLQRELDFRSTNEAPWTW